MFGLLKKIFGIQSVNFAQLVQAGAIIVDVRTPGEFSTGHIMGAINIPVTNLENNLNKLKDKNKTIITCCASGMRSASAKGMLQSKGYLNVHNGGAWSRLNQKLG